MMPDALIAAVAAYAHDYSIESAPAFERARCCLVEALAACLEALQEPACARLLGPIVPGASMPGGARVPGTSLELDPVHAAFNIGALVRWGERGERARELDRVHRADCVGAILAVADYLARRAIMAGKSPPRVRAVLAALIKAQEIQGALALDPRLAGEGMRGVLAVRLASAAVIAALLGGSARQIGSACSHAWLDGAARPLDARPNGSGTRSRWATADAASRGVRLAFLALIDEERGDPAPSGGSAGELPHPLGTRRVDETCLRQGAQGRLELLRRLHSAIDRRFPARQAERIHAFFSDLPRLEAEPVNELLAALVANGSSR